ncbi:hypothetical protein PG993_015109 [Apiospora rasikravindrae]|uniref:Enoyl reductase (ER) domain-containing protein n=1 Tax=Apiospora rasikravindrae TaxID=990691 RepID=A0ABR1RPN2_9PEZI
MKECIILKGPTVKIVDSPIPEAKRPNDVVIKVVVSGSNPKDWKCAEWMDVEVNQGDDIAGIVHEVGSDVTEFKKGDRVAAFHEMLAPGGSYAEYAVAHQHTTFHIPSSTSFEAAAAIPLAAMTSAVGLYLRLQLPQPWTPAREPTPLVIYGAASSVGAYAIQLARRSNIHPLICVAGASTAHVESLIDRSQGDTIVDYREGDEAVQAGIRKAVPANTKLLHAFDAVSEHNSYVNLGKVLSVPEGDDEKARLTLVLPGKVYEGIPGHVEQSTTMVGDVHGDHQDFGHVYFRYLARGLLEGWFKPQPQEVIPGGLGGVQKGLENLRDGKARGVKYVFRIAETEGVN